MLIIIFAIHAIKSDFHCNIIHTKISLLNVWNLGFFVDFSILKMFWMNNFDKINEYFFHPTNSISSYTQIEYVRPKIKNNNYISITNKCTNVDNQKREFAKIIFTNFSQLIILLNSCVNKPFHLYDFWKTRDKKYFKQI